MFRLSGLFCIVFAVVAGTLLFKTSQSVQRAEQDLSEVQKQVRTENESLRILTAEWDYLNRPERLEKLTLENLDMDETQSTKTNFIQSNDSVPEPYMPVIPQVKPEFLRHVSTVTKKTPKAELRASQTIQNAEREKFDTLIENEEVSE